MRPNSTTRMTLTTAIVALATSLAAAQSSSLFLRSNAARQVRAAATTQPVGPDGSIPANAGSAQPADASANLPLRGASLIAVVPPEPKRFRSNDLVNIVVRHQLQYQADGRLDQNRTWQLNARLSEWFRIHDRMLEQQDFQRGTPQARFDLTDNRRSNGRNQRQDQLTTRIEATVIDVKPNGNLVLEARAEYQTDEEVQVITLTGTCRGEDVSADNSILSDKIANLEIRTTPRGAVRDTTKRGFIPRLFDAAKPF